MLFEAERRRRHKAWAPRLSKMVSFIPAKSPESDTLRAPPFTACVSGNLPTSLGFFIFILYRYILFNIINV